MSKMTFDEMMEYLTKQRKVENEEEFVARNIEFMNDILNVGHKVLTNKSDEQIAGMLAIVQTIVFQSAMDENNIMLATLANTDLFTDSLPVIFKACAGILTMEEVR